MKRNYSRLLVFILGTLATTMAVVIAFALTSTNPTLQNGPNSANVSNPDDATPYIKATEDANGVIHIQQDVIAGDQTLYIGKREIIGDYMYVYGYYYNSSAAPNTSKLTGWKLQTSDLGWGCAAISKTKTTYTDPAGFINGQTVTWMNNCYNGCKSIKTNKEAQWRLPNIPATVKHTDNMFANCTGLTQASITTAHTLTANTFSGCTNLKNLLLGQNVQTVQKNAFRSIGSDCRVYCDATTKPSGFENGWNTGISTVYYNADALIWAVEPNYIPTT